MGCNVKILDKNLVSYGMLTEFVSLVWCESYNEIGSIQLVVNKSENMLDLLKIGRFLGIRESKTLAYIHSIEDNGTELWVYAKEAKWLLSNRVYTDVIDIQSANVEATILDVVSASRLPSLIECAAAKGLTGTADADFRFPYLSDVCQTMCIAADYGWTFIHDKSKSRLIFTLYEGNEVNNIKFAERYGNLADLLRTLSIKDHKNIAYVGGEERNPGSSSGSSSGSGGDTISSGFKISSGVTYSIGTGSGGAGSGSASGSASGVTRVYVVVGDDTLSGLERREMFVDASDIVQGDMTDEQYTAALKARGLEELALYSNVDSVQFSVIADIEEYGVDYTLGDWLTCVMPEYELIMKARITGVRLTWENNTKTLELTMGTAMRKVIK